MYHHKQLLLGRNYLQQVLSLLLAVVVQYIILQLVIKQWGTIGNTDNYKPYTFSYPLKLNVFCTVLVARECTDATEKSVSIQSKTLNDVVIYGYHSTNIAIFVIGKQQWGLTAFSGETVRTITLHISCSQYLVFTMLKLKETYTASYLENTDATYSFNYTDSYFKIVNTDGSPERYFGWIAICYQQWGVFTSSMSTASADIIFPVSFPSIAYGSLVSFNNNTSNGAEHVTVDTLLTNFMTIITYSNNNGAGYSSPQVFWLTFGEQQWGYFAPNPVSEGPIAFSVTYTKAPIVISNACFIGSNNFLEESYGRDAERITTSSFYVALGADLNYPVGWIAIGYQQWGYRNDSSANGQNTLTCNLPIAMSNTNYVVARDTHVASTSGTTVFRNSFGTMSKTTTSFTYRYHSSDTGYTMHWFACGY